MAFGLVAASCNNDKGKKPLDRENTNRDKDDYNNRDNDDRNNNRDDDDNRGSWSSADKRSWMRMCADPLKENMGEDRATTYCECVLEKIQEKYSTFQKANTQGTEAEGREMGQECITELGYQ